MPKRAYSVRGKTSNYRTVTGYTRKKGLTANARTTKLVKQIVQKQLELKTIDISISATPLSTNYSSNTQFYCVNAIQEGSGNYNRNGKKIMPQSVRIRGIVEGSWLGDPTLAIGQAAMVTRVVVIWDKFPTGSLPNWNQVFEQQLEDGTDAVGMMVNKNVESADRFTVLRDIVNIHNPQYLPIQQTNTTDPGTWAGLIAQSGVMIDEFISLKGKVTEYNATANPATVAQLAKGGLYIAVRANINQTYNYASIGLSGTNMFNARFTYFDG